MAQTLLALYLAGGLVAYQDSSPTECRLALATAAHMQSLNPAATFVFEHEGRNLEVLRMECVSEPVSTAEAGS